MAATTTRSRWIALQGAANVRDLGGTRGRGRRPDRRGRHAPGRQPPGPDRPRRRTPGRRPRRAGRDRPAHRRRGRARGPRAARARRPRRGPPPVAHARVRRRGPTPRVDGRPALEPGPARGPRRGDARRSRVPELPPRPARLDRRRAARRRVRRRRGGRPLRCRQGPHGRRLRLGLATVGVPRPAIVADYAATGERLVPLLARLRSSPTYAEDMRGRPDESHRPRPETMRRFLGVLDERHGGAPGWLDAHGFGDDAAPPCAGASSDAARGRWPATLAQHGAVHAGIAPRAPGRGRARPVGQRVRGAAADDPGVGVAARPRGRRPGDERRAQRRRRRLPARHRARRRRHHPARAAGRDGHSTRPCWGSTSVTSASSRTSAATSWLRRWSALRAAMRCSTSARRWWPRSAESPRAV